MFSIWFRFRNGCATFVLAGLLFSSALVTAQEPVKFSTENSRSRWAVDESTNRIFAILPAPSSGTIVEYDLKGKPVRSWDAGGVPLELAVKDQRLLVAVKDNNQKLLSINLETNAVSQSVRGPYIKEPALFETIETRDPHLFVIGSKSGRFNVFDIKEMRTIDGVDFRPRGLSGLAISNTGDQILSVNSSGNLTLHTFSQRDLAGKESKKHSERAKADVELRSHVSGKFWSIDNQVWDKQLNKKIGEFPGKYIAVHPRFDLVFSFDLEQLVVSNLKSGKRIAKIEDIETPLPAFGIRPEIQFLQKGKLALLTCRQRAYLLDLGPFTGDATEIVGIQKPAITNGPVETELKIPLRPMSEEQKGRVQYTLVKGPQNARIRGDEIVWTPAKNELGKHDFVVKATIGSQTDELTFQFEVRPAVSALQMSAYGWNFSPTGNRAIIIGSEPNGRVHHNLQELKRVAVIDTRSRTASQTRELTHAIKDTFLTEKHFYATSNEDQFLYRYDLDNLKSAPKKLLMPGNLNQLQFTGDGKMLAELSDKNGFDFYVRVIDQQTMQFIESDHRNRKSNRNQRDPVRDSGLAFEFEQGILVTKRGALSKQSGELICPVLPIDGFPTLTKIRTKSNRSVPYPRGGSFNARFNQYTQVVGYGRAQTTEVKWSRVLAQDRMTDVRANLIYRGAGVRTILDQHPVMVQMDSRRVSAGSGINRRQATETKLTFRDLMTGAKLNSQVLKAGPKQIRMEGTNGEFRIGKPIKGVGDQIICYSGNEIFFVDLPAEASKGIEEPLRLKFPERYRMDLTKTNEFQVPCNQKSGLTFELSERYAGVSLDRSTGKIKFDKQLLTSSILEMANVIKLKQNQYEAALSEWKIPDGRIAVNLPINVSVTSDSGHFDVIQYNLLLMVDDGPVKASVNRIERRKKFRRAVERHMMFIGLYLEQCYVDFRKQLAIEAAGKGGVDNRLDALSARLRSLQRSIQKLERKLEIENPGRFGGKSGGMPRRKSKK